MHARCIDLEGVRHRADTEGLFAHDAVLRSITPLGAGGSQEIAYCVAGAPARRVAQHTPVEPPGGLRLWGLWHLLSNALSALPASNFSPELRVPARPDFSCPYRPPLPQHDRRHLPRCGAYCVLLPFCHALAARVLRQ